MVGQLRREPTRPTIPADGARRGAALIGRLGAGTRTGQAGQEVVTDATAQDRVERIDG